MHKFHASTPNSVEVMWRKGPHPPNHHLFYGFTQFAMELNEMTPDLVGMLPCTDTRRRPDQRMYEEGQLEGSEREKLRLEQRQRDHRKHLEAQGQSWRARWFEETGDSSTPHGSRGKVWRYRGGYWEARGKFEAADLPQLW
jgi:oxysterol-binding protein-related protein 3/6/7